MYIQQMTTFLWRFIMDVQSRFILLTVVFLLVGLVRGYCAMKEM